MGIDPNPLTLRQLLWMAHGVRQSSWGYLSHLMCLIANVNAAKGKRFKPADFNPMLQKAKRVTLSPKESIEVLLKVFVQNGS